MDQPTRRSILLTGTIMPLGLAISARRGDQPHSGRRFRATADDAETVDDCGCPTNHTLVSDRRDCQLEARREE